MTDALLGALRSNTLDAEQLEQLLSNAYLDLEARATYQGLKGMEQLAAWELQAMVERTHPLTWLGVSVAIAALAASEQSLDDYLRQDPKRLSTMMGACGLIPKQASALATCAHHMILMLQCARVAARPRAEQAALALEVLKSMIVHTRNAYHGDLEQLWDVLIDTAAKHQSAPQRQLYEHHLREYQRRSSTSPALSVLDYVSECFGAFVDFYAVHAMPRLGDAQVAYDAWLSISARLWASEQDQRRALALLGDPLN